MIREFGVMLSLQDINSATAVHQNLQGAVLPSSGRGGLRIQYPFCMLIAIASLAFTRKLRITFHGSKFAMKSSKKSGFLTKVGPYL